MASTRLTAHEKHVHVNARANVVGEVVTFVIRVVVDDDLIAIPVPAMREHDVAGGDAEIEAANPEADGSTPGESPNVARAEAAGEAAVLPRMVEIEANVGATRIVADPMVTAIHVRSLGMAGAIAQVTIFLTGGGMLRVFIVHSCRPVRRRLWMVFGMAPLFVSSLLREAEGT